MEPAALQSADADSPEHSHGGPLDEPQPSTRSTPAEGEPGQGPRDLRRRAYIEALLEGVPLPATKKDLARYAKEAGDKEAAATLRRRLPSRRFSSLDEVGEALAPVQPSWPRERHVPKPESDVPPGGQAYGKDLK
jgi:hypothetical protein